MQRPIARGPHPDNDSDTIVATIWKSQREAIVVRACVFNGYASINTRIAYRAKESDDLRYTKEGFTTKPGAETEQLIQALIQANKAFVPKQPTQAHPPGNGAAAPHPEWGTKGEPEIERLQREGRWHSN